MTEYRNVPTVVVMLVPVRMPGEELSLLIVRRKDSGKLALPGGYQEYPDSLRTTGAKEVKEETGIDLFNHLEFFRLVDAVTVPDGRMNLVFFETPPVTREKYVTQARPDGTEVSEIAWITDPTDLAFPIHQEKMMDWFARRNFSQNYR